MGNIAELLHELRLGFEGIVHERGAASAKQLYAEGSAFHSCLLNVVYVRAAAKAEARAAKRETKAFRKLVVLQAKAAAKAEAKAAKVEAKAPTKAQERRRLLKPGYEEQLTSMVIPTTAGEGAFAPSELGSATQEPSECLRVAAVRVLVASMTVCAGDNAFACSKLAAAVQQPSEQ